MIKLKFKRLTEEAILPIVKDNMDAGIDLSSCEEGIVFAGRTEVFSTGLSLEMEWNLNSIIKEFNSPSYMQQYYDSMNRDFSYSMNHWMQENMVPYFHIVSRSGLATKGIHVGAGIVDCGYRGEIKIVLHNINTTPFRVERGDRIAQGIVEFKPMISIEEVSSLSETERGINGFGSSGV